MRITRARQVTSKRCGHWQDEPCRCTPPQVKHGIRVWQTASGNWAWEADNATPQGHASGTDVSEHAARKAAREARKSRS